MPDSKYTEAPDESSAETRTDYSQPGSLLRPLKAVRAKCLDCTGGSAHEVKLCPSYHCPLWSYRLGKRPTAALYTDKPPRYGPSEAAEGSDEPAVEPAGHAAESRRACASEGTNGQGERS